MLAAGAATLLLVAAIAGVQSFQSYQASPAVAADVSSLQEKSAIAQQMKAEKAEEDAKAGITRVKPIPMHSMAQGCSCSCIRACRFVYDWSTSKCREEMVPKGCNAGGQWSCAAAQGQCGDKNCFPNDHTDGC